MFFGGDGFPGFDGGRGARQAVDNEEYYKLLEIQKNASNAEIKKAYRKLAIKHHPDKGGDIETFKKISEAYDVLGTPEKKELYDKYGKEGVEQGGGMHSADDVFSMFFGGGKKQNRGPQKGPDATHQIAVDLEDLYNGKRKKIKVTRKRIQMPDGMTAEQAFRTCTDCDGRGVVLHQKQSGFMIQQFQVACKKCKQAGTIAAEGVSLKAMTKVLEIVIEKGMQSGEKIVFSGESDDIPGGVPGDVVVILKAKEHNLFKRKGADLMMISKISLKQALTGFTLPVKHLDGRTLLVERKSGQVVRPNSVHVIGDEGMPIHKRPTHHGRLFIVFQVEFPKTLTEKQLALLKTSLPATDSENAIVQEASKVNGSAEDVEHITDLKEIDGDEFGRIAASENYGEAYDSDEEEHGGRGGQRMQCQQQ